MQQYPLTSGTGNRRGNAWTNRVSDTGHPTLMTAGNQYVTATLSGIPTGGTAAVAEVREIAWTGTPNAHEVALLGLSGTVYAYEVVGGDTLHDVLDGLVAAASADPHWTTVRAGDSINATAIVAGVKPANAVAAAYLGTLVSLQFASNPHAGDVTTLHVENNEYAYVAAAGDTVSTIATALVAQAASDPYWDVLAGGAGEVVARCLYPSEAAAEVSVDIVRTLDVYGNPFSGLHCTKTSHVGDVACTVSVTTPGAAAIPATRYSIKAGTHTYTYVATPGDTLNDCAVALATAISANYTVPAPPAAATIAFNGAGSFAVSDLSSNGGTCTCTVVTESNPAAAVGPSSPYFWLCQQQDTCSIVVNPKSGTSVKATPWLWNNATGTWSQGTTSSPISSPTLITVNTTNADGLFVELSNFVGSCVADVVVQSVTPTP